MSSPRQLNLKVTIEAREFIARFLADCGLNDAVFGIGFGRAKGELHDRWFAGAHQRADILAFEQRVSADGYHAHCVADGIELLIPQLHLLSKIEGKTLSFDGLHIDVA